MRGVNLGTKAAKVPDPDGCGERYELRPCLKVIVHENVESVNDDTRRQIAEVVVKSIENRHAKRFASEDYNEWLDFITLSDKPACLLSDNEVTQKRQQETCVGLQPGAQFKVESNLGTWSLFAQNTVTVCEDTSRKYHHGLTCAHCVLPPSVCMDIVHPETSPPSDPDPAATSDISKECHKPGGLYEQWLEANVSYLIPEKEQSSIQSQLEELPIVGITSHCKCCRIPCTCHEVAISNQRYDCFHRWLSLTSLYPSETAPTNFRYFPGEIGGFVGAIQGFYPAIDDYPDAPFGPFPVRNAPPGIPKQDTLVTGSHVNIDFGAISVVIPDRRNTDHTVKSISPSHITKWKTAQKFGHSLMPPNPQILGVKPTALADSNLPVYALNSRAPQEGRMFNQTNDRGQLITAEVITIPETDDSRPFFKRGDSGCVVYTLHGASKQDDFTGVVFGVLFSGGTLQEQGKGRYFVFPLCRALKLLTPQLNYRDAQFFLREGSLPVKARKKLKRYVDIFTRAEKMKKDILAKTYDREHGEPLEVLHEIYLAQCNNSKSDFHTRGLSFQLDLCVSDCGEPSYCGCTDERVTRAQEMLPNQHSAKPTMPCYNGDKNPQTSG